MTEHHTTQQIVHDMMAAPFIQALDARQRHLHEAALHSLIRLAKSEQMLEIRQNSSKLTLTAPVSPLEQEG